MTQMTWSPKLVFLRRSFRHRSLLEFVYINLDGDSFTDSAFSPKAVAYLRNYSLTFSFRPPPIVSRLYHAVCQRCLACQQAYAMHWQYYQQALQVGPARLAHEAWSIRCMKSGSNFIATSHDRLAPKMVVNSKGIPRLFQENLGWWNIIPFGQMKLIFID